jgi:hypothetical protein
MLTHVVDFTKSIANAVTYAEYEKSQGLIGTYFVQTKYIRDFNDDIFFDDEGIRYLKSLAELGMEIGSHTVARSKVFKTFPMGTGAERYPSYTPFVKDRLTTFNGTILVYRTRFSGQRVNIFMPPVDAAPQLAPELGYDSRAAQ